MKIGKVVKVVTLPDAIPAQLPKVRRIPAPLWPVRKPVVKVLIEAAK